jgi:hypothetical protein
MTGITAQYRKSLASKSDDRLNADIEAYWVRYTALPARMFTTRRSSNARLQAHMDERFRRVEERRDTAAPFIIPTPAPASE